MEDALRSLERTLGVYARSLVEFAGNASALHLDVANVYPAAEALSPAVMTLNSSAGVLRDAGKMADDVHGSLSKAITGLLGRLKELTAKADERQVCRAEIAHYREKVTRLANEGLANAKAQSKAESNQEKLLSNQTRFKVLDAELTEAMATLDHEVAEAMNAAIAHFVASQSTFATGLLHCYGNALAAIPGAIKTGGPIAAVAVSGGGAAAAAAAASGGGSGSATGEGEAAADGEAAPAAAAAAAAAGDDAGADGSAALAMSAFLVGGAAGGAGVGGVEAVHGGETAEVAADAPPAGGAGDHDAAGGAGSGNPFE